MRSGDLDGEEAWKPSRDPAGISVEVDRQYPHRMGTDNRKSECPERWMVAV